MKHIVLGLCLLLLTMGCRSDQKSDVEMEVTAAKAAIMELATALQSELKAAMQTGGPVAAIGVCNTQAMPITQKSGCRTRVAPEPGQS